MHLHFVCFCELLKAFDGLQCVKTHYSISKKGTFSTLKLTYENLFMKSQIGKCLLQNEPNYVNFGLKLQCCTAI